MPQSRPGQGQACGRTPGEPGEDVSERGTPGPPSQHPADRSWARPPPTPWFSGLIFGFCPEHGLGSSSFLIV